MRNRYSDRDRNYGRGNRSRPQGEFDNSEVDFPAYRRSEHYFGGGQTYGEGYSGNDQGPSEQSSWRSGGRRDHAPGRYRMNDEPHGYGPDNYGRGDRGYSDYRTDRNTRREPRFSGHGAADMAYYNDRDDRSPNSERGFRRDFDRNDRDWWDKTTDEVSSWFGDEDAERRREMDARRSGSHRGTGPKNYQRSDDRIKDDVNDRLTDNSLLDASDIEVDIADSEVTLSGTVDSRYAKRLAEDLAEDVSGVSNVENRLRVKSRSAGNRSSDPLSNDALQIDNSTSTQKSRSAASGE